MQLQRRNERMNERRSFNNSLVGQFSFERTFLGLQVRNLRTVNIRLSSHSHPHVTCVFYSRKSEKIQNTSPE